MSKYTNNINNLQRFVDAHAGDFIPALKEIQSGRKRSHWMWYIFPQIQGLGFSSTSKYYAIENLNEAGAFLQHPVLRKNLTDICRSLLDLKTNNANSVFGSPDDMKLKSSMTLFSAVPGSSHIFEEVLKKFFNGEKDERTLEILRGAQ